MLAQFLRWRIKTHSDRAAAPCSLSFPSCTCGVRRWVQREPDSGTGRNLRDPVQWEAPQVINVGIVIPFAGGWGICPFNTGWPHVGVVLDAPSTMVRLGITPIRVQDGLAAGPGK